MLLNNEIHTIPLSKYQAAQRGFVFILVFFRYRSFFFVSPGNNYTKLAFLSCFNIDYFLIVFFHLISDLKFFKFHNFPYYYFTFFQDILIRMYEVYFFYLYMFIFSSSIWYFETRKSDHINWKIQISETRDLEKRIG